MKGQTAPNIDSSEEELSSLRLWEQDYSESEPLALPVGVGSLVLPAPTLVERGADVGDVTDLGPLTTSLVAWVMTFRTGRVVIFPFVPSRLPQRWDL